MMMDWGEGGRTQLGGSLLDGFVGQWWLILQCRMTTMEYYHRRKIKVASMVECSYRNDHLPHPLSLSPFTQYFSYMTFPLTSIQLVISSHQIQFSLPSFFYHVLSIKSINIIYYHSHGNLGCIIVSKRLPSSSRSLYHPSCRISVSCYPSFFNHILSIKSKIGIFVTSQLSRLLSIQFKKIIVLYIVS